MEQGRRHQRGSRTALKIACLLVLLVGSLVFAPIGSRAESDDAAGTVRMFYEVLLGNMRDGAQLGQHGRYARLEPVIVRVFDVSYMTRMAVGRSWAETPEPKQRQLAEAFGRYVTATWADRFDSFSGEHLDVIGAQSYTGRILVHTRIVKASGEPVTIDYLMRQNGNAWQIADVYLAGTISELATLRSEFSAILRSQGTDALIAQLNQRAEIIGTAALPSDRKS